MQAENLFIIDLPSAELTADDVACLSHPLVAGLILFSRHFVNIHQLQNLIQSIRQQVKKPLLICVDQEGGRVQRFREGFTQLPAAQAFSLLNKEEQVFWAREAGWQMASEMLSLDIDLSFAPVLDLGSQCLAIGDRSFGADAETVMTLGDAFIEGMHQAGMAATGKHFPGHGAVIADSHRETPVDKRSKQQIFSQDIQPFAQLIQKKALQAIMPAHVIYPDCDPLPASGSPYWLRQILRQELGFDGVIFSDDLNMQGAAYLGTYVERSEKAFQAGCDLLLLCNNRTAVKEVLATFKVEESCDEQAKRLQRLQPLYKSSAKTFVELKQTARYQRNVQFLSQLQQRHLQQKIQISDPTER